MTHAFPRMEVDGPAETTLPSRNRRGREALKASNGARSGGHDSRYKVPSWPEDGRDSASPSGLSIGPKIHIIDEDMAFGTSLAGLLASAGLESVHYPLADRFLAVADFNAPGCLLLEVGSPSLSALDFQARLSREAAIMPVVLMTEHGDVASSVRGMKTGAVDYLVKPFERDVLLAAIDTGLARNAAALDARAKADDARTRHASLTHREREVMLGVTKGLMNKQIAGALSLTEFTVKVHRGTMMRKMQVRNVPDLVRLAQLLDGSTH
jgi:FixJ family two-component response regulator